MKTRPLCNLKAIVFRNRVQYRCYKAPEVKHLHLTRDVDSIAREVRSLLQCQGSHVLRLYGLFCSQQQGTARYALVSELADGDLLSKVFVEGQLSELKAKELLLGILKGLKRIHEQGIAARRSNLGGGKERSGS